MCPDIISWYTQLITVTTIRMGRACLRSPYCSRVKRGRLPSFGGNHDCPR